MVRDEVPVGSPLVARAGHSLHMVAKLASGGLSDPLAEGKAVWAELDRIAAEREVTALPGC